jgi:arginyl-tRNA synthetase
VVGNEQNHHFQVLFAILKKMGYAWAASNYHLSYGMVELPSGKMKSREGTVVDADDIMDEMVSTAKKLSLELGKLDDMPEDEREELFKIIGLGALKYYLLKVEPKKQMLFDPEESIDFNGHTGPFIQYSYTRIQSLVKKAGANYNNDDDNGYSYDLDPLEKGIIKLINQYPSIIKEAGDSLSPALIANYVYELAKEFNHFYQSLPILKLDDEQIAAFRINLAETTGRVIKSAMNLLGIDVPDQM